MGRLTYSAIASLDGYVADADGNFRWAAPDAEVHAFVNELESEAGTYLLGRRMYETLAVWDSPEMLQSDTPEIREYAEIWLGLEKVVYSTTLEEPTAARTRLERSFDPDAVRAMKDAADREISVGGPGLASEALRAGLVDEIQLFLNPVIIGAGTAALPDDVRLELELREERRFENGVVFLRYDVKA